MPETATRPAEPASEEGRRRIARLADRHGFSADAAATMLAALQAGGGRMAQFSHPEFGGMGQWSSGGMLMIGDMFNNALRARVGALADELAAALSVDSAAFGPAVPRGGGWWPEGLGEPSASGSQNGARYAVFPAARRLVVDDGSGAVVYDTGDHVIGGASQQQGAGRDLSFRSQHGPVRLDELRRVGDERTGGQAGEAGTESGAAPAESPARRATPSIATVRGEPVDRDGGDAWQQPVSTPPAGAAVILAADAPSPAPRTAPAGDPLDLIERLAALRDRGVLSEEEFAAKKRELLSRL